MNGNASNATPRCANGFLFLAATAWPWGGYQLLYGRIGLFSLALVALFASFMAVWVRSGRPRIPFDLFWPAGILALCGIVTALSARDVTLLAGAVAFVVAMAAVPSPHVARQAMALSVLSSGAVAFLSGLAEFNRVFPTCFSADGTVVAGPLSPESALFQLGWSVPVGVTLFLQRQRLGWRALPWLLPPAVAFCAAAACLLLLRTSLLAPDFAVLSFPALPFTLFCLYVAARVAARIMAVSTGGGGSGGRVFGVQLAAITVLMAASGAFPDTGLCFSFGLVAALGVPPRGAESRGCRPFGAVALVVAVVTVHFFVLFPGDVRDYSRRTAFLKETGQASVAARDLDRILHRYPGESPARLLRAELDLDAGRYEAAVDQFSLARRETRQNAGMVRTEPQKWEGFLSRLEARTAGQNGMVVERALLVLGREEEALARLRKRVQPEQVADTIDPDPLRRALAVILSGKETLPGLEAWTTAELLGALRSCDANSRTAQAPADMPRRLLPAVLAARSLHTGRAVCVTCPGGQSGRTWSMPRCEGDAVADVGTFWLDPERDAETGEWFVSLAGIAEVRFGSAPALLLTEDPALDCCSGAGEWSVLCLLP